MNRINNGDTDSQSSYEIKFEFGGNIRAAQDIPRTMSARMMSARTIDGGNR